MHDASTDDNLAIIDDDELDEASVDLLDLHFMSITLQHERKQLFLLHPNVALQEEINTHEGYIVFVNSLLGPVQQQIITRFQNLVTFGDRTVDFNARAMIEMDLADLKVEALQKENELNATDLNKQIMHDLNLEEFKCWDITKRE